MQLLYDYTSSALTNTSIVSRPGEGVPDPNNFVQTDDPCPYCTIYESRDGK